ncbi:hypothetical protein CEQ90_19460 [Lewinellaceae bacterium SD302]|nr:hypothetical protein CEQ90_19460 [Lewinellaceae bacterium SD302]
MLRLFATVIIFLFVTSVSAQFYDNHWMLGYYGGDLSEPDDSFGISIMSFYEAELKIENDQQNDIFFNGSGNTLSDYEGDLFLFSNNLEIRNAYDEQILNGVFENNELVNRNAPQAFVYLPFEQLNSLQYVQMNYSDDIPKIGEYPSSSSISTNEPIQLFNTIDSILPDLLTTGEVTACKHANGRDWWVLLAGYEQSFIYSILFTPDGVSIVDLLEVDFIQQSGLGQAVFSPDGNHYVRYNNVRFDEPAYLDIFDFDRCTGQLYNHRHTTISPSVAPCGAAISPSSRYLYISHQDYIFQYDLWADNIFATQDTVAIYDGYTEWNLFSGQFYLAQLAPDGKIYLNAPSSIPKLHVIEFPDRQGIACEVRQHSVQLPNNNATTLANHPNYRLGPVDGSVCDSLGIDNFPRAYFRVDRDADDTLDFHFQNLSFYEPETRFWTFGDGNNGFDLHEDHTFAGPGIYEVCLTVTNDIGTDTYCRTLELGPSSLFATQRDELDFTIFPNPVRDLLVFDLGDYLPLNGQFVLRDALGRAVLREQVLYRQARIDVAALPAGVYYYNFWDGRFLLGEGKVVVASP